MAALEPFASRPLRVFVVENHADTRLMFTMLLTQLGHEVQVATSMHEALALLPRLEFDVLISDIGLPDGDGWQLLQQLGWPRERYAIAMSGYGMSADRERSKAAGFRHHLVKPMDVAQLEGLLAEAARERLSIAGATPDSNLTEAR